MSAETDRSRAPRSRVGVGLVAALLAYAVAIHHGVGPIPPGGARHWYEPNGWLLDLLAATSLGALLDGPVRAFAGIAAPAVAVTLAVFAITRSALARTLAVASLLATMLFLFYGLGERSAIWQFFRWRGSVVMAGMALVIAVALCAPLLAASWLRLRWPARLAAYLPPLALCLFALRDVTGTNPALPFAISPWPVITMFGMELGSTLIAGSFAALALPLALLARFGARSALGWSAALAIFAAPAIAFGAGELPAPGLGLSLLALVAAAVAFALPARRPAHDAGAASRLDGLAIATSLGSLFLALPLSLGLSLVERDHAATREGTAQTVIDALARWFAREGTYPDSLDELVAAKELASVPVPEIGFGLEESPQFTYQNFGTSYILEFSAPRWVQCAFNPPFAEDEGEEEEEAATEVDRGHDEDETEDVARGAWSCPSKPPELW